MTNLTCNVPHSQDPDRPRQPAPGAQICYGHINQGQQILHDLPGLALQLAGIVARSTSNVTGAKSAETTIPYVEAAADQRQQIRRHLAWWVNRYARENGVTPPDLTPEAHPGIGPCCQTSFSPGKTGTTVTSCHHGSCVRIRTSKQKPDDVRQLAEWLTRWHHQAVRQEWATLYAVDLRNLFNDARALLAYRSEGEATRLLCPNPDTRTDPDHGEPVACPGTLRAPFRAAELLNRQDITAVRLECADCGWQVHANQWLDLARYPSGSLILVTDQDAELWTLSVGRHTRAATIRSWANRGHITRHDNPDGGTLYDLDEIKTRLDQTAGRQRLRTRQTQAA